MNESNPKLIGLFVLGGFGLVIGALVLFSSWDYLTPKRKFVAYFQQSVNGLNVGAPIKFRGIPVGEVLAIEGVYDPNTGNMIPRLVLEFRPETLENAVVQEDEYTLFPLLVENGLRASLKSTSLLTGQLYVAMDFHPDVPVRKLASETDPFPEMPTLDSGFDEAIARLSDLPIEEVLGRAAAALAAAEDVLRDPNIGKAVEAVAVLAQDADATVLAMGRLVGEEFKTALNEASATLVTARQGIKTLSARVNGETLVKADRALVELQRTLEVAQQRLNRRDPLNQELLTTLREISAAARSADALMEYLEQHPEALLKGKQPQ